MLKHMPTSDSLTASIASTGLRPPSQKQAQRFVRKETTTSWEQFVLELHYLPQFLAELKTLDPSGTYFCETKMDAYSGMDVQTFHRYFVSWGAAQRLVHDIPLVSRGLGRRTHEKRVWWRLSRRGNCDR